MAASASVPTAVERQIFFMVKRVNQAIRKYRLLDDGDRVAVAVSGGKDSLALLRVLLARQVVQPERVELVAVHVTVPGAPGSRERAAGLEAHFRALGVPYALEPLAMGEDESWPLSCHRCAWNRRKTLFTAAQRLGCNKIALGHHADDAAQTTLLNLFHQGRLESISPRRSFFDGLITVIRPLILTNEKDIVRFAKAAGYPIGALDCPQASTSQRAQMAAILREVERTNRRAKNSLRQAVTRCRAEPEDPSSAQPQRRLPPMSRSVHTYSTLNSWIARESIPFSVDSPTTIDAAVDAVIAQVGDSVEVLGMGEALHGGEAILTLRNRLFRRLVEAHGYTAIAIESSFPRGHAANEYVAGRGPGSYEAVQDAGFSHGFGRYDANRELVEWMRRYNADPSNPVKLRFYGFDGPTEMTSTESPRHALQFALDYLASVGSGGAPEQRERIAALLGPDSDWENPAAMMDPTKSVGRSPAATALRIETEDLVSELRVRRPDWVDKSDEDSYLEALQHASVARQLLDYHAELARQSSQRTARLLGMRDAMMADNLAYVAARERGRGKVLAFAHNSHLQRGQAQWQLGADLLAWWPVGAHLKGMFGSRYAVIGSAVGVSEVNGIGSPEAGTLEGLLVAHSGDERGAGAVHSDAPGPGATDRGNRRPSGSLRQREELNLLRTHASEFHRFRLVSHSGHVIVRRIEGGFCDGHPQFQRNDAGSQNARSGAGRRGRRRRSGGPGLAGRGPEGGHHSRPPDRRPGCHRGDRRP